MPPKAKVQESTKAAARRKKQAAVAKAAKKIEELRKKEEEDKAAAAEAAKKAEACALWENILHRWEKHPLKDRLNFADWIQDRLRALEGDVPLDVRLAMWT